MQMKLYTEKQVKQAIHIKSNNIDLLTSDDILGSLTPIELPSDEEVEKNNPYEYLVGSKYYSPQNLKYWEEGAKWVIEQIKQQDNGI